MKNLYLLLILIGAWQNSFGASFDGQSGNAQAVAMHVLKKNQGYYTHNCEGKREDLSKKGKHVFAIHFLKDACSELIDDKSERVCYEVSKALEAQGVIKYGGGVEPFSDTFAIKKSSLILMLSLATRKKIRERLKQYDGITFYAEVPCKYADLADHMFGTSTGTVCSSMCMNVHDGDECCIQ